MVVGRGPWQHMDHVSLTNRSEAQKRGQQACASTATPRAPMGSHLHCQVGTSLLGPLLTGRACCSLARLLAPWGPSWSYPHWDGAPQSLLACKIVSQWFCGQIPASWTLFSPCWAAKSMRAATQGEESRDSEVEGVRKAIWRFKAVFFIYKPTNGLDPEHSKTFPSGQFGTGQYRNTYNYWQIVFPS